MTTTLESVKLQTESLVKNAMKEFGIDKYANALATKINDICLELGFSQEGKDNFEALHLQLDTEITTITNDPSEIKRIYQYASKLMKIGTEFQQPK